MAKIIGYILALIGLVGIASSVVPQIGTALALPLPEQLSGTTFLIIAVVITIIGIFFITRGGGRRKGKGREVPIYHGKDVVGYRRT